MANPGRAPILRTKSVTKKQMNKCMAEIRVGAGFELRNSRTQDQYPNHWAKEISPWRSNQVLYLNWEYAMQEGVVSHNTPPLKVIIYWWLKALLGRKSDFGQQMGLMAQWPIPDEPPSYERSP